MKTSTGRARSTTSLLMGPILVLVVLCLVATSAATGGKKKLGGSVAVVEEVVTAAQKASGPAGPSSKSRKDGANETAPPRPGKFDQPAADLVEVVQSKHGATGRKLLALGDPCTVTLRNACRSRRTFNAAFGYYTYSGPDGASGWVSEGWWNIRYGRSLRFTGQQVLYVLTSTGLKPTLTSGKSVSFCVSVLPYTILMGDDDVYYNINEKTDTYYTSYTCSGAGGYFRGGFWPPAYCGVTLTYSAC